MRRMEKAIAVVGAMALLLSVACAYPTGAPDNDDTCSRMIPGHRGTAPMTTKAPFEIKVSKSYFKAGDSGTIKVTIKATGDYKIEGFLIQARRANTRLDQSPVGYWLEESDTKNICGAKDIGGNALTHSARLDKTYLELSWHPRRPVGHIIFRVTIVSSFKSYWVREKSSVIRDVDSSEPVPTPAAKVSTMPASFPPIDVEQCGKTKGCYRNPPGCTEETCDILVTWKPKLNYVSFEMVGDSDGWVAMGFSEDKKMGNDDVMECVWNEDKGEVMVRQSWNTESGKDNEVLGDPQLGLHNITAYKSDGRIKCRFDRIKKIVGYTSKFDLDSDFHFLKTRGAANLYGDKGIHVLEPGKYPYVSPNLLSLNDLIDISGTCRYPLVKVHAILMLIGWMMCSSVAILMAKYYKSMWPNDSLCREKVWFAVHRGCMATCLICTIIGFILIFVHVGGYSQMPELPAKAHPPLGIVTTILCVLNPLLALCRCSPEHTYRPVFNWVHWFIGTVAFILQTPTIFIGLNLPKAHVPWWATWVMVAFMLFHLIIELLLEIHGCMNSKKQKMRNEEYEFAKKSDPRGHHYGLLPEPVGKGFKRNILSVYLFVVIVLGIVMVVTIAVS